MSKRWAKDPDWYQPPKKGGDNVIPFRKPHGVPEPVLLLDPEFDQMDAGWPPREMLRPKWLADDEEIVLLPCDTED
jgi:hypothetical protein